MDSTKINALMQYLARGWALVPLHDVASAVCSCSAGHTCKSAGKHPRASEWQRPENLITSPDQLMAALARWPASNWGLATGLVSGVWALDYDPKAVTDPQAAGAVLAILAGVPTWQQRTGSGGAHWLFALPEDFIPNNSSKRLPAGFDVRGARAGEVSGGQIVLAPSVSGVGTYEVLVGGDVLAAPAALLDLVRPTPPREPRPGGAGIGPVSTTQAGAYVAAALFGELQALRDTATGRNNRAYQAACRVLELANTGLVDREAVWSAWWAAAAAHPDPNVTVPDRELLSVWSSAERRVGDRPADLSGVGGPSGWGGDRIPFSAAPGAAPGLGQAGSGSTGAPPPADRAGIEAAFGQPDAAGLTLPEEFWRARAVFGQIRQAAHARTVSGDVALYSTLARLAALWPHRVRADTGVKSPASLNLYVAIVGPSGAGKSSGISVAESLVPRPPWLKAGGGEHDPFADDVPLGTGEGLAEAYMGTTAHAVPQLDGNGDPLVYATGERAGQEKTKQEKVRRVVRHNVLVHADEGESLARMLQRSGATVGESLRRAWAGATIGQQNGRTETTRIVKSGQYSLGLLIGFQRETCQDLLADGAAGTPQRFLWAWATDPSIPKVRVSVPSVLAGVWSTGDGNHWLIAGDRPADERPVTFDAPILDELFELHHGLSTGTLALPELDAHMPLTKVKVAVLLAQLEGRRHVTVEDWHLAGIVWLTSCRVRDHLVAFGRAMRGKESAAKRAAHAGDEAAAEAARHEVRSEIETAAVERVARWLSMKVAAEPDVSAAVWRSKRVGGRDRRLFGDALLLAVEWGWIEDKEGILIPGPSQPRS
ncbi:MAG: bifunctional DNA primase/polymerase [Actinoplanes sp.]